MFNIQKYTDSPAPDGSAIPSGSSAYRAPAATVIAKGVRVEGEFVSQGDVQIEGEVQGKITAAGKFTAGPESKVTANVSADEAAIAGVIEGNLTIAKHAIFHASARVNGDIIAERITVESGAVLNGHVSIGGHTKPVMTEKTSEKPAEKVMEKQTEIKI